MRDLLEVQVEASKQLMVEPRSMMMSPIQSRCSSLGVVGIFKDEGSDLMGAKRIFSGIERILSPLTSVCILELELLVGSHIGNLLYIWHDTISLTWWIDHGLIHYSSLCVDTVRVGSSNCLRTANANNDKPFCSLLITDFRDYQSMETSFGQTLRLVQLPFVGCDDC